MVQNKKTTAKSAVAKKSAKKWTESASPEAIANSKKHAANKATKSLGKKVLDAVSPKIDVVKPQIKISAQLRKVILDRAKQAFDKVDTGVDMTQRSNHITRCHNVQKSQLVYRVPADARNMRGLGIVVKRKGTKIVISDRVDPRNIVTGLGPLAGWLN